MPSLKGKHRFEDAILVADQVVEALTPHCECVAVCGSIRRRRQIVGDVDVIAVVSDWDGIRKAVALLGGTVANVTAGVVLRGVSVDISFVQRATWGAALLHYTGPMEENIRLRLIAKKRGLKLSQHGLRTAEGTIIAGMTEQAVYAALGLSYVEPERRDVSSCRVAVPSLLHL